VALKPQMGLVFVLVLLVRGHRRAVASAMLALLALGAVAVARLWAAGVDWLPSLLSNLAASGSADPLTPTTQRLNLQALFNAAMPGQDRLVIDGLTLAVGAIAAAVLFAALRRRSDRESEPLAWAGAGVLTLLMVYNRSYNAVLLLLPLAWAFAPFARTGGRRAGTAVVLASLVFLVPGAAAMAQVRLPPDLRWVQDTPAWWVLRVHQIVALLVVLAAPLSAATAPTRLGTTPRAPRPGPGDAPPRERPGAG
jgi:hypothetical protein